METVKDAIIGIGVIVIGTIAVITLCIVVCALADAIRVVFLRERRKFAPSCPLLTDAVEKGLVIIGLS